MNRSIYCTDMFSQAKRWAVRYTGKGIVNQFQYNQTNDIHILRFSDMTEEWLGFIVHCRQGKNCL